MKRDGVCNPVTHILKAIKIFKRFGRGCNPRPARNTSWSFLRVLRVFGVLFFNVMLNASFTNRAYKDFPRTL